jgi:hypothetical protein
MQSECMDVLLCWNFDSVIWKGLGEDHLVTDDWEIVENQREHNFGARQVQVIEE